ncbi:hypothetical protein GCM10023155_19640 [Bremerella cremea]
MLMQTRDFENEQAIDQLIELVSRLIARAQLIEFKQEDSECEGSTSRNGEAH